VQGGDELASLTRTFNGMASRLADVEASRQRWLADVAHELRTPVTALRAEIEAVQDGMRPVNAATAERLHRQVMRLGRLIDDLRLTMHHDLGAPPLDMAPLRPVILLVEAATNLAARFERAGLALEPSPSLSSAVDQDGPAAAAVVHGDAQRLGQVFLNLLENSLKYTDTGGRVTLDATVASGWLHLDLQDGAPGPDPAELPRLFDRFYRAEASRSRATGGSGLGLSICKSLVEAHGGRIAAQASPLGGLWIRVSLPLAGTAA